eukprot:CAMPEP_0206435832 /NCGR_PEP_ID=MMETSP0324_2-20121206/10124_1 /ASSEMBLY_ACC=CAM_ASM_000836 /TAXON_ID=2866 /ORGANISM="Crypthecodinium cohnii, Strain Seligo" /LENGTH=62 /DNA_ID=CAMNT_0053902885 /DNA_START=448 /DNA_END=636 /DNA_ORIENTATION=+
MSQDSGEELVRGNCGRSAFTPRARQDVRIDEDTLSILPEAFCVRGQNGQGNLQGQELLEVKL